MERNDRVRAYWSLRVNSTNDRTIRNFLERNLSEIDRQTVLQAGFQQHLSKPLNPKILIQVITRLI